MKRYRTFLCIWFLLHWLSRTVTAVLHSNFLQPGNGVIKETWYKISDLSLDAHIETKDYPTCPDAIQNLDDFNDAPTYESNKLKYILVRYKSHFIPRETGNYRFYLKCKDMCSFKIEAKPSELRKLIEITFRTSTACWDCNASQSSRLIYLFSSVRYYIEVLRVGAGNYDFAALGFRAPSNTYERPIRKISLQRTLSLYNWHGMLAEYYSIAGGARPDLTKMPSQPTEVRCMSETNDNRKKKNFAIKATGYFYPQQTGSYKVKLGCENRCVFYFSANGSDVRLAQQDNKEVQLGILYNGERYYMRIDFYKDDKGSTSFSVRRMKDGSSYKYFKSFETRTISAEKEIFDDPTYTVNNSTSITMHWNRTQIPFHNNFNFSSYYVRFWPSENSSDLKQLAIEDELTTSKRFSGLGIWTTYQAQLWYVGKQYTLRAKLLVFRTGEDVPSLPPSRIYIQQDTSASMIVGWQPIPLNQRHGVLTGFEIRYRIQNNSLWLNASSNTVSIREKRISGLMPYTVHGFKVAGKTSIGTGVFSVVHYGRTKEDAPSAAPVEVAAYNLSSTVLEVTWGKVPFEGRNGIVRGYVIYYKLKDVTGNAWQHKETSVSENKMQIRHLKHWSFYEIKVAAKTVAEGQKSDAVIARTDENVPVGPPQNVTVNASSSRSILVKWTLIPYEFRNGIITGYEIMYNEADSYSSWVHFTTTELQANITGVEEYFEYIVEVAGITSKGVGAYSKSRYVKTLQDAPSAPPDGIAAKNTSANSLLVSWKSVPYRHQNGIITGYMISYRDNETTYWFEVILDAAYMQKEIIGLKNYTWYEIKVAAITKIGIGTFNKLIHAITDENVPSAPPIDFKGNNATSRSIIVFWHKIPLENRNGVSTGYRVKYKDAVNEEGKWTEATFNATANNGTIYNLRTFTPYYIKIAGITIKGVGVFSKQIKVWTEEDFPDGYPMNFSVVASSSTSISLRLEEKHTNDTNGILLAYVVFYKVVKCPSDMPSWCSETAVNTFRTKNASHEIVLTGLRKFMEYIVWVRSMNKIGTGPPSPKRRLKTATDFPKGPPELVESFSRTFTSISIFWNPIRESLRNGVIIRYRIFYRPQDEKILKTHRVARNIPHANNVTVEGLGIGESYQDVNGNATSAVIDNLQPFRWYLIRIGGMTKTGLGPVTVLNASCRQSVAVGGPQINVHDKYSFHEISIDWSKLGSFRESRGTILEYNVKFWPSEVEMQPTMDQNAKLLQVKAPIRSAKLRNLTAFTKYAIRVAAVTQTGPGAYSRPYYGETCRCEKKIQAIKRILPPLITRNSNDSFTLLIDSAIRSCCSTCADVNTTTDWEIDTHGEGVLSAQDVFEEIERGKEVYTPQLQVIHTLSHLEQSYGLGDFVPIIKSPGVAMVRRKITPAMLVSEKTRVLLEGIGRVYPVFMLSLMLLLVQGYLHWFSELNTKASSFDDNIKSGLPQALWFSFVTTSGIGYGDFLPTNFIGRFLAIVCMLLGIVWKMLLFASTTVTCLVYLQEDSRALALTGRRVAVTNQTQLMALKKGASIVKVFDLKQQFNVINTVLSGEAELALLDGLSLVNEKGIMENSNLEITEFIDDNQYYGIIVSGKAKKIGKCINMYIKTNKVDIQRKLEEQYDHLWKIVFKRDRTGKGSSFQSHEAKIFKYLILAFIVILVALVLMCVLYEKRRKNRMKMQINPEQLTNTSQRGEILLTIVGDFVERIYQRTEDIELKHAKQLISLSDKKYAINIVPEVIEMFGDADYEQDMKEFMTSVGCNLATTSVPEVQQIAEERNLDINF